ncbi:MULTISPECIES: 3-isopropylmalate dehydrogenase [Methanothrix]|jgi:3-isopropylmalate dehydrogenase|uniref:3-isopropylmalate dehydrogenase n=2 Tax=Methanothrix soehngenii TaxID=2223 RepID=F4C0G0_METSG|nr:MULTISPECIES: 3-isopropylmalate dehydrogenase [Methanothrix]OPX83325.1 MAG: 3-isopropylmalate/3-methylmalate dehydrogenase [Methanosaeta sp. PtaB.Bin005]AEB67971.1 3-isopropylmalate dehydrogenase [Methanothrix soehngenii GP6]MDD3551127.1 3-isopropylmalate dehydrogenase [Methanothrix soehngenii]MDY0411412.1 3-isopropylmalate dehydrogenase [Methanothrix soehngenii]NLJ22150.1 3-isopropylmalate dehydrogenase [Methanothrix soehngenii]
MNYKVPVISGDGIGPEIIAEGQKVLEAAADKHNFSLEWIDYSIGAEHYLKTGELISEETLKELSGYRAIYLGAIGDPRVKPGVLEKGVLLTMRFYLDQYINLRPVKLLEGVWTPLKDKTPKDIDFVVVRENTEDFYIGIGSRAQKGKSHADFQIRRNLYNIKFGLDIDSDSEEIAYQIGEVSREGCQRVIKYAFDLARKRHQKVSSVDKANVLSDIYGFWREVLLDVAKGYPEVKYDFNFVDAITMWFVKNPEWFDVVVAPNMFGDIITDLGAMIQGGLGLAPGANLNPEGTSMFEPIHGSAPKYKGRNMVNPLATIWAGALLLEHLGQPAAAEDIVSAIERNLFEGRIKTYDLGGSSTTSEVGSEIARLVGLI